MKSSVCERWCSVPSWWSLCVPLCSSPLSTEERAREGLGDLMTPARRLAASVLVLLGVFVFLYFPLRLGSRISGVLVGGKNCIIADSLSSSTSFLSFISLGLLFRDSLVGGVDVVCGLLICILVVPVVEILLWSAGQARSGAGFVLWKENRGKLLDGLRVHLTTTSRPSTASRNFAPVFLVVVGRKGRRRRGGGSSSGSRNSS